MVNITLKFVGRYFIWVVTIFAQKNRAILVQKMGGGLSKYVSSYLMTKKNPPDIKPEGGGCKTLMSRPLRKDFFFRLPLVITLKMVLLFFCYLLAKRF